MSLKTEYEAYNGILEEHYFDDYYYEESALDIWNNCVVLSVLSVVPTVSYIVGVNFLFGCLNGFLPIKFQHILSGCFGIFLICTLESLFGKLFLLSFWILSLLLLQFAISQQYFNGANFLKFVFILLLVLCEYFFVEPEIWMQIRGILMILVMKIISFADDCKTLKLHPTLFEYFGYTLCSADILLGPWISFTEYSNLFKKRAKKNFIIWICSIIKVLATSVLFLTLSNCWSEYFIPEGSNRWLTAYKEAFSFRTGHYFISFLAEAGMISYGFKTSNKYRFVITEPLEIEFPSSLSVVVKKWNQPMHDFLKKYIYQSWLKNGKFSAIFATFLISSFLHGFEMKVSIVLVTIGIFSYLQVAPRNKISELFNCCVRVRACKDCNHKFKRNTLLVKLILFLYSFATIFHLTYLGILMDPTTDEVGIYNKWQQLYFSSHFVMIFNCILLFF